MDAAPNPHTVFQTPAPRGGVPLDYYEGIGWSKPMRFKPLRLGAVFLWPEGFSRHRHGIMFQTPAPRGGVPLIIYAERFSCIVVFQTPAPRGGVPLEPTDWTFTTGEASFKPLRLGAVFLCKKAQKCDSCGNWVSNPCASGRCSSGPSNQFIGARNAGFKPLRLGAVFLCPLHFSDNVV